MYKKSLYINIFIAALILKSLFFLNYNTQFNKELNLSSNVVTIF